MKRKTFTLLPAIIVVTLSSLLLNKAYGQQTKFISKVYSQFSTGSIAVPKGGFSGVGIQVIFRDKWCGTMAVYNTTMEAKKNLPQDFDPGSGTIIGIPLSGETPMQHMQIKSLTGGKYFRLGRSIWLTTEAGFSINEGQEFNFIPQPVVSSDLLIISSTSSNYKWDTKDRTVMGAMFKANMILRIWNIQGVGLGAYANLNALQSQFGMEFNLPIGWLPRNNDD